MNLLWRAFLATGLSAFSIRTLCPSLLGPCDHHQNLVFFIMRILCPSSLRLCVTHLQDLMSSINESLFLLLPGLFVLHCWTFYSLVSNPLANFAQIFTETSAHPTGHKPKTVVPCQGLLPGSLPRLADFLGFWDFSLDYIFKAETSAHEDV